MQKIVHAKRIAFVCFKRNRMVLFLQKGSIYIPINISNMCIRCTPLHFTACIWNFVHFVSLASNETKKKYLLQSTYIHTHTHYIDTISPNSGSQVFKWISIFHLNEATFFVVQKMGKSGEKSDKTIGYGSIETILY